MTFDWNQFSGKNKFTSGKETFYLKNRGKHCKSSADHSRTWAVEPVTCEVLLIMSVGCGSL